MQLGPGRPGVKSHNNLLHGGCRHRGSTELENTVWNCSTLMHHMPGSWKGNSHQKCPQSQEIKEINFKEIWRHILVILIDNSYWDMIPEMP